ncbi:hypothetical protein Tco_0233956, partial [Tanacetum coccineum]
MTASPLEEGGDRTDSVTGPSLRTISPSARSAAPVMTEATTVATVATTIAIPADVSKDKSAPHPSIFCSSSSSEKTEAIGAGLEEIYVPEWTVTKGFELNDGYSCANMMLISPSVVCAFKRVSIRTSSMSLQGEDGY